MYLVICVAIESLPFSTQERFQSWIVQALSQGWPSNFIFLKVMAPGARDVLFVGHTFLLKKLNLEGDNKQGWN